MTDTRKKLYNHYDNIYGLSYPGLGLKHVNTPVSQWLTQAQQVYNSQTYYSQLYLRLSVPLGKLLGRSPNECIYSHGTFLFLSTAKEAKKKLTSLIFYCIDENTYHKLPKIHQYFFIRYTWRQKDGGGVCYLSGAHKHLPQFFAVLTVDNHGNCHIFWKNCSFTECVPQKTTSACVDSNPRGIQHLASSVVVQNNPL